MLDLGLEVVDRLVEAVDELEEGVGRVVDGPVEDVSRGPAGVDPCRDAVHRSERPVRSRPTHGEERGGRGDHVEHEVLRASLCAGAWVNEHAVHAPRVAVERRPHPAAVADRLQKRGDRIVVELGGKRVHELLPGRVDEIGPVRRHGASRLLPRSAGATQCLRRRTTPRGAARSASALRRAPPRSPSPPP